MSTHGDADYVDGWSQQLGWQGGSTATPSWGFEFPPAEFVRVVESVRGAEIDTFHPGPQWIGYWSFPVKDPMGYTVEISTPERTAWPAPP